MEQKLSGGFENPKFILRSVAATSIAILIAGVLRMRGERCLNPDRGGWETINFEDEIWKQVPEKLQESEVEPAA